MAYIYGTIGKTNGEQAVYHALSKLPDDWFVYSEPEIHHPEGTLYPDFVVIHKDLGLIVIEVKDWLKIDGFEGNKAKVTNLETKAVTLQNSPVTQARTKCFKIQDLLLKKRELIKSRDQLLFPWRFAGFLPNMNNFDLQQPRLVWGENQLYGGTEVSESKIEMSLRNIPAPFSYTLNDQQLNIIRGLMDPSLRLANGGILDKYQEAYAKAPLAPGDKSDLSIQRMQLSLDVESVINNFEENLPTEVTSMSSSQSVRLIRGTAGTGKTDVVVLRSCYLKKMYPESRILVTTFNIPIAEKRLAPQISKLNPVVQFKRFGQICHEIIAKRQPDVSSPQSTEGVVERVLQVETSFADISADFGTEFLVEEVQWMKELNLISQEAYLNKIREGRGGKQGRNLTRNQKSRIFEFYETYQTYLDELPAQDWNDWFHRALKYIKDGTVDYPKYDEIIVDEAQHFAPKWVELLILLLKENGSLFLCEDPTQSVYRVFSWKQKGVSVQGRTKWLRVPYRSTRQILRAAYALVKNNATVSSLLSEEGPFQFPDLSLDSLRDGRLPQIHRFDKLSEERSFVRSEVSRLVAAGVLPGQIAVLHNRDYVLKDYDDLAKEGIVVDEVRRETGMEYDVVILPKVNDFLNKREGKDQFELDRNQADLYTAFTRARDRVYVLHEDKQPIELRPILDFAEMIDHTIS